METLYKKGLKLEYFTVGYNFLEAAASLIFGGMAASIALIGFGLDSIVESLSGIILIWRLSKGMNLEKEQEEKIERRATRFVAITFFILGIYVFIQAIRTLANNEPPEESLPGIIIAILSLIIMPILAKAKINVGKQINSKALIADAKETLACSYLSAALLLGLGANYLFGFWQADPIASLIIVYFLFKEGKENWAGEEEEYDEQDTEIEKTKIK